MGLLTKEIEVKLTAQNIERYEKIGYEIPRQYDALHKKMVVKRGTTITVNINDLTKNAKYPIEVECDNCGKRHTILYGSFMNRKYNDHYYCHACTALLFNSGENNSRWNPDLRDEDRVERRLDPEYCMFVQKVLARDNYTCICCFHRGDALEVHHLDGYNWNIEGRKDPTNAVTLCKNCHASFHSIYGKGKNTRQQFEEWIGKTIGILESYDGVLPIGRKVICYETLKVYDNPVDVENKTGILSQRIIDCCNKKDVTYGNKRCRTITANGQHFFWLDEYEKMSKEDFKQYFDWCKPLLAKKRGNNVYNTKEVVCLTTMELFKSLSDAAYTYDNLSVSAISRCCKGHRKHAGILPDGTLLEWMYYDDYKNMYETNLKEGDIHRKARKYIQRRKD